MIIYLLYGEDIELGFCLAFGALITTSFFWVHEYFFSQSIKLVTFNINDDRRLEGPIGDIFPELKRNLRAKKFKKFIDDTVYNHGRNCIFNFVEILPTNMLPYFETMFYAIGYKTSVKKYCSDSKSFSFLLAWNPAEYDVTFSEQVYFTKSGNPLSDEQRQTLSKDEIKKECMGAEFEKSMPVYYIKQKSGSRKFFLGQFHCGLTNEHKKQVSARLNEYATSISTEIPFVVAGDWNCFDSESKTSQYYKGMFDEISDFSYMSTFDLINKGVTSTFKSFDYDMLRFMTPEQKSKFNTKLSKYESKPSDELKAEIREFLSKIISDANEKYQSELSQHREIGISDMFSHPLPQHVSESLIMDMVVGWNLPKAHTEKMEIPDNLSDHSPLMTTIF